MEFAKELQRSSHRTVPTRSVGREAASRTVGGGPLGARHRSSGEGRWRKTCSTNRRSSRRCGPRTGISAGGEPVAGGSTGGPAVAVAPGAIAWALGVGNPVPMPDSGPARGCSISAAAAASTRSSPRTTWADRSGDRHRPARRDGGPGDGDAAEAGSAVDRVPTRRDGGHPPRGRLRGRGDLERRHQPVATEVARVRRGVPGAQAGRTRSSQTDRREDLPPQILTSDAAWAG
jgi:hypothetical protein